MSAQNSGHSAESSVWIIADAPGLPKDLISGDDEKWFLANPRRQLRVRKSRIISVILSSWLFFPPRVYWIIVIKLPVGVHLRIPICFDDEGFPDRLNTDAEIARALAGHAANGIGPLIKSIPLT